MSRTLGRNGSNGQLQPLEGGLCNGRNWEKFSGILRLQTRRENQFVDVARLARKVLLFERTFRTMIRVAALRVGLDTMAAQKVGLLVFGQRGDEAFNFEVFQFELFFVVVVTHDDFFLFDGSVFFE